ncbi:MAG: hypothetical protein V1913_01910, partial [Fibrobacterota bacterium]
MMAQPFLTIALLSLPCLLFAQADWTWRNPLPTGANYDKIIFVDNEFIALSADNYFNTSTDGVVWNRNVASAT